MPPPTLFIKGKLRAPDGDPKVQAVLDNYVPIDYLISWFRQRIGESGLKNRVLILKSQTGSGKSTGVPAEIFRHLVLPNGKKSPGIICTQPRTVTAIRNVPQIVWESGPDYPTFLKIGDTIGWSTKFNKLKPRRHGLLSATIGTLAQQLGVYEDAQIMETYRFILIDEVHERDLQTDMTIYMLKNFLVRNAGNPKCPFLVLMSATFDPARFLRYFDVSQSENFIWCEGRSYGISTHWDWNNGQNTSTVMRAAAAAVEAILRDDDDGLNGESVHEHSDILIFMPGLGEIKDTALLLTKLNERIAPKHVLSILQVDSDSQRLNKIDYRRIDIPLKEQTVKVAGKEHVPTRRVVLSTNVAETGITIKSLKYVIDSGYNREIEFNPNFGIRGLLTRPAPKSRIFQRMGRVGRLFYGHFYPLYPELVFKSTAVNQLPQILIEDVSPIILRIICEQLRTKQLAGKPTNFVAAEIDMLDVPSQDTLHAAMEKLYVLGFVAIDAPEYQIKLSNVLSSPYSGTNFGLSKLGILATMFNMITPENIRMILAGYTWGASILDLITIATYLTTAAKDYIARVDGGHQLNIAWENIYSLGAPGFLSGDGELYRMRALICDEFIDGIIIYNAAKTVISKDLRMSIVNLQKWCTAANLKYDAVINFVRERDGLIEQMISSGFDIFRNSAHSLAKCSIDNFMDIITRLKYCIYEGYRLNIATGDQQGNYKIIGGATLTPPRIFRPDEESAARATMYEFVAKLRPKWVLYSALNLKHNKKNSMYNIVADRISVMDGFVNVDFDAV